MTALVYIVALALSVYHFLPSIEYTHRTIHQNRVARNQENTPRFSDSFLVGIFSEDNEQGSEHRKILRHYYKRHSSPHVCSLEEYRVQEMKSKGGSSGRICDVAYTFVVGSKDENGDDMQPSVAYSCVEKDCTHLDVDDGLEAKGQAFLEYAASLPLSFDNVAKMDDTSFYAAILKSVGEMWSLKNKGNEKQINSERNKTRLLHYVDANHPADYNNHLIYGSHRTSSPSKSIFAGDFFMTMELVDFIAESTRLIPENGDINAISRHVLSHLRRREMISFNRKRMPPPFESEQIKMEMPKP